jgi:tetratricopeptide (TPR) repeat protein
MIRINIIMPIIALMLVVSLAGCSGTVDLPPGESVPSLLLSGEKHANGGPGLNRRYDLALIDFNKVLEVSPNHPKALRYRATAYENLDKRELATKDWDKLIDLKTRPREAYYKNRGENYSRLGYNERALKDFTKSIELADDDGLWAGDVYLRRSAVYESLHQPEKAAADEAQACRLGIAGDSESNALGARVGFRCKQSFR